MKILLISPKLPYPLDDGGKIVTYNTLKHLALRGNNITLFCFIDELKRVPELEKYCRLVLIKKDTSTSLFGLLLNLFSKVPYTISKYHNDLIEKKIQEVLEEYDFDLVHLECLHTAYYGAIMKRKYNLPIVLREENVETKIMERYYRNQRNPLVKAYAFLQYRKLYKYESMICKEFDKCFMITDKDVELVKKMNPMIKTAVIPSGVDASYFLPLKIKEEPCSIISVGSMDWLPNVEGILWFYKEVFPLIKEIIPEAKLYIVGKNPPGYIKKLRSEYIIVSGFVEDVRGIMAKCQVFIVPLKTGSGMRIKILNALAMGRPIVSTSIGCEGIEVQNGKNICIANTREEFAQGVIELMKNESIRKRLGEEGIKLVKEKYKWEQIAEKITDEYNKIIEKAKDKMN